MNNSTIRPQPSTEHTRGVDNQGSSSTGLWTRKPLLTRAFTHSSTIHTPYYSYESYFIQRADTEEGTTCAYPS